MNTRTNLKSVAVLLALPLASFAQDKANPGKSSDSTINPLFDVEPGETVEMHQVLGLITALDNETRTITIDDAKMGSQSLHIGVTTKLMHGDKVAKWNDLKVGVKVKGTGMGDKQMNAETLVLKD